MKINKIILGIIIGYLLFVFIAVSPVSAHVTVKPGEVAIGARVNFVVNVPTEEEMPTISVRLIIPEGLISVRPNVKPGWNIEIKKTGEGEEERVSEIIWTGGRIPAELKDEFVFSAQAPTETKELVWKAYQTYQGGKVIAWENDPKVVEEYTKNNPPMEGEDSHNDPKPFSVTRVIDDLKETDYSVAQTKDDASKKMVTLAIFLSLASLGLQFIKKK